VVTGRPGLQSGSAKAKANPFDPFAEPETHKDEGETVLEAGSMAEAVAEGLRVNRENAKREREADASYMSFDAQGLPDKYMLAIRPTVTLRFQGMSYRRV